MEAAQKAQVLGLGPNVSCESCSWVEFRVEGPAGSGDGRSRAGLDCREREGDTAKPGFLSCALRQVAPYPHLALVSPSVG